MAGGERPHLKRQGCHSLDDPIIILHKMRTTISAHCFLCLNQMPIEPPATPYMIVTSFSSHYFSFSTSLPLNLSTSPSVYLTWKKLQFRALSIKWPIAVYIYTISTSHAFKMYKSQSTKVGIISTTYLKY